MNVKRWKFLIRLYNRWRGSKILRRGRSQKVRPGNARLHNTRIEIEGHHALLELGTDVRLFNCHFILRGSATQLVIGPETHLRNVRIVVEDRESQLVIGAGTSMTRAIIQSKEGGQIEIGRDCMIGHQAEVANTDSHSVLDAGSGERLNPPANVVLEDHVWIGARTWVAKGSRIGSHSVIAAGSRVSGPLPRGVLAAGNPAQIKRTAVTWDRRRFGAEK